MRWETGVVKQNQAQQVQIKELKEVSVRSLEISRKSGEINASILHQSSLLRSSTMPLLLPSPEIIIKIDTLNEQHLSYKKRNFAAIYVRFINEGSRPAGNIRVLSFFYFGDSAESHLQKDIGLTTSKTIPARSSFVQSNVVAYEERLNSFEYVKYLLTYHDNETRSTILDSFDEAEIS